MQQLDNNVWIVEGEVVSFYSFPFSTRMTIVRLDDGRLWIHSPIRISDELQHRIDKLGTVAFLVAPNHLHHLFLREWQVAYPLAMTLGTQQVINKRKDLKFDRVLDSDTLLPWGESISHLFFTGSPAMQESIFFHQPSSTLIVTDLIENFEPSKLTPFQRCVGRLVGIVAPNGKMPIDWRFTFSFSKREAREHVSAILAWQPKRIVMSHGNIVEQDAVAFLTRSFSWLNPL
ncbi:DUF4336 domain-containing protein [Vibrio sp. LaRot3]|uniref:DUF4336 domain-containing protein n=1 Tax=Vibrio sp. LaRot3 TaxID=2998829 RepID=UPI0022CDFE4E|nr:DUF4336 domain-containing protein [Vibrio sp. LaRot3]MDA0147401.1 DUF4336 domain-containing protein [Vibrio sp. LaRot3]